MQDKLHEKILGWLCYQIVIAWPGTLPNTSRKWFAGIDAVSGTEKP